MRCEKVACLLYRQRLLFHTSLPTAIVSTHVFDANSRGALILNQVASTNGHDDWWTRMLMVDQLIKIPTSMGLLMT